MGKTAGKQGKELMIQKDLGRGSVLLYLGMHLLQFLWAWGESLQYGIPGFEVRVGLL